MDPQASDHARMIETLVRDILEKMGFEAELAVERDGANDAYVCRIRVDGDQNFLIGQHGVNLAAIQHVVRVLARKKTGERLGITVDVNGYFTEKKEALEREAREAAAKVAEMGAPLTLRPMQAYERKVIHAFLAENASVRTESVGAGSDRCVSIHPKNATLEEEHS